MSNSNNLTINVLVHERRWTLHGCLTYLKNFEGSIIVADSSATIWDEAERYPWVEYRHLPGMPPYDKFRETIESANTEFILNHPDDDFILLSALDACCSHMERNPDVVSCMGHLLKFRDSKYGPEIFRSHIGANISTHIQATQMIGANETAPQRIRRLFDNIVSIAYSVMRKDAALAPYRLHSEAPELKLVTFWDKLILFALASLGRVSHLDSLYMLRGSNLFVKPTTPAELELDTPSHMVAQQLTQGVEVMGRHLKESAEINSAEALEVAKWAVERVAKGYNGHDFDRAARLSQTMVEHAISQQNDDFQEVLRMMHETWRRTPARDK